MSGIIAFDLDGTLLPRGERVFSERVRNGLQTLVDDGWELLFATGRPWKWAFEAVGVLTFPYKMAVLNGVFLKTHPTGDLLYKKTLSHEMCAEIDTTLAAFSSQSGFVAYDGEGENIYWEKKKCPSKLLPHAMKRQKELKEKWTHVESFQEIPLSSLGSVRYCFQNEQEALSFSSHIEAQYPVSAPVMRDAFSEELFLVLLTDREATKGASLAHCARQGYSQVVAVGDDRNDLPMFEEATLAITFSKSPACVREKADLILDNTDHTQALEQLFTLLTL